MTHTFNERATFVRAGASAIQTSEYVPDRVHDYRTAARAAQMARANRWRQALWRLVYAVACAVGLVGVVVACWRVGV